jgi:hypothetical protein
MTSAEAANVIAARQPPAPGSLNLDHVAHFVPDSDAASLALRQLGFTLTPFSPQSHRLQPNGPLVPAGTGNRCVMFEAGYVEFLTPTAITPVADQLRAAIQRYVGVHLIAFGTSTPEVDHARLCEQGFEPLTPVSLQRPIGTEGGEDIARFTVVRVPPGTMPEGRIQYCQHHTPDLVWQKRWLDHENGAKALAAVLLCVEDPPAAARRFSRFSGLPFTAAHGAHHIETARGTLTFVEAAALERTLGVMPPALPWIAGYALDTTDLARTREYLVARAKIIAAPALSDRVLIELPQSLGGVIAFQEPGRPALRFN